MAFQSSPPSKEYRNQQIKNYKTLATLDIEQENDLIQEGDCDYKEDLGARRDYLKKSKNSRCGYDPQKSIRQERELRARSINNVSQPTLRAVEAEAHIVRKIETQETMKETLTYESPYKYQTGETSQPRGPKNFM